MCHRLRLDDKTEELAKIIFEFSKQLRVRKVCPYCNHLINRGQDIKDKSLIVASIYLSSIFSGEWVTQQEIQKITGIPPITIRKYYTQIAQLKGFKEIIKTEYDYFVGPTNIKIKLG